MFKRIRGTRASEILVEVLMIVVGINVALWFEGVFDDIADRKTEQAYLTGLRDDLETDLAEFDRVIGYNVDKIQALGEAIPRLQQLEQLPPSEQITIMFEPSSYDFFEPADFTLRSMQESGDFRLLSNDDIKRGILRLVRRYGQIEIEEANFIQGMDDEYVPLLMRSFDITEGRLTDPGIADNQVFRNFFPFALENTRSRVALYQDASEQAAEMLAAIESELDGG